MAWQSDIYPGKLVYEPLPDKDAYMVIWRTERGDFFRGVKTLFELLTEGAESLDDTP